MVKLAVDEPGERDMISSSTQKRHAGTGQAGRRRLIAVALALLAALVSLAVVAPTKANAGPPVAAPCVFVPVVFGYLPVCPVNVVLSHVRPCDDGWDNDRDGTADYNGAAGVAPDPGCSGPEDSSEYGMTACDNGVDDDGDGGADVREDYGCESPTDASEHRASACDDGLDNDNDGNTDWPRDPECQASGDLSES